MRGEGMREARYSIAGLDLRLRTDSPAIGSAVARLLRSFPKGAPGGPQALELVFRAVGDRADLPTVPPGARLLASGGSQQPAVGPECRLHQQEDGRKIAEFYDQVVLIIDDEAGRVEGYVARPEAVEPGALAFFFHVGLAHLLARAGLYTIHAAALERGGRGVLLPGASGRGKTTCCLALLRGGYRLLSDDHPLLRDNGPAPEILPFPEKIDVTEDSLAFFPELDRLREHLQPGPHKRYFHLEDVFPDAQAGPCRPAAIILPTIVDRPTSSLEPLPKSRALEEILPHTWLSFDKDVARRQFRTLTRLVESTSCYRLHFGEDVGELPRLVDQILSRGG